MILPLTHYTNKSGNVFIRDSDGRDHANAVAMIDCSIDTPEAERIAATICAAVNGRADLLRAVRRLMRSFHPITAADVEDYNFARAALATAEPKGTVQP